jgi:hypothetical protein
MQTEHVLKLINQTNQNIFLTGKAGTGKTTLLKKIVAETHKNHIIVAPTGVAAINAGGVTIHSMFQLPFNAFLPTDYFDNSNSNAHFDTKKSIRRHFRIRADKRAIINNLELLIIDEVSMLRPDVLDAMNEFLQFVRYNRKPFGGVQVLFIGDLLQLPPIIKQHEWDVMSMFYNSKFFFDAHILKGEQPIYIELMKIYRQSDIDFIEILQQLRENKMDEALMERLEKYVDRDFDIRYHPGYIVLTTHNQQADYINQNAIEEIRGREEEYGAKIVEDFPEHLYPLEKVLKLKVGAQVMFIKNDLNFEKRYYNGKIGVVKRLEEDEIVVEFPEENTQLIVDEHTWENIRYKVNPMTQEIEEEILGTFTQFPLRLAWAITVHKSQGLTFEKAAMDISQVFAPGQAYVALSRLTSLSGLKLLASMQNRKINVEREVISYSENKASEEDVLSNMEHYSKDFVYDICMQCFDYTSILRWSSRMKAEIASSGEGSMVGKYKLWLEATIQSIANIEEVAKKFQASLTQIIRDPNMDFNFLNERIEKAYEYFYAQWQPMEQSVLEKLAELAYASRVKEFENDMHEIEGNIMNILRNLVKTKKIVNAILNNEHLEKNSLHTNELESMKRKIIDELKEKNSIDLNSLIQPFERKSKKAKGEPKEEKKPTHIISYELWSQHKSIEKIAELRKLTKGTIFGHLAKYVEKGAMDITDLISIDRLKELETKIGKIEEGDTLNGLKSKAGEGFEFHEIRLYQSWKRVTNN